MDEWLIICTPYLLYVMSTVSMMTMNVSSMNEKIILLPARCPTLNQIQRIILRGI